METVKKIYILHGWAYTTEKWGPFVDGLVKLGYTPVLLKIPGLTAPIDRAWHLDDYVSWLAETLKGETGPVIILGHSNGGRIAVVYAEKFPQKVSRLILVDSAGVYHRDMKTKAKRKFFGAISKLTAPLKKSEFLRRFLYTIIRETDYLHANPIMQETMRNLIAVDLVPVLKHISIPVLLIWGKDDTATPLSDGAIMAKEFPNAKLEIIVGARHSPQFTHVAQVLSTIGKNI